MQFRRKKGIVSILAIVALAVIAGAVVAQVLYSLRITSTWNVTTAYGLQLEDAQGHVVSSIAWGSVPRYGTLEKDYTLRNIGDKTDTVVLQTPANTSAYMFQGWFDSDNNQVILQPNATTSVTLLLTDLNMSVDHGTYSGVFFFNVTS